MNQLKYVHLFEPIQLEIRCFAIVSLHLRPDIRMSMVMAT